LYLVPRQWKYNFIITVNSGRYIIQQDSFCPSYLLSSLGGSGYQLALTNADITTTTVVINQFTNITSEQLLCNKQFTVAVPPSPAGPVYFGIPACQGLNVTIYRQVVELTGGITLVPCGPSISASSFQLAAAAYKGIPADVSLTISQAQNTIVLGYNDQSAQQAMAQLDTFQFMAESSHASQVLIDAIAAKKVALANLTIIPQTFWDNPVHTDFTDIIDLAAGMNQIAAASRNASIAWNAGLDGRISRLEQENVALAYLVQLANESKALQARLEANFNATLAIPVTQLQELGANIGPVLELIKSGVYTVGDIAKGGANFVANGLTGVFSSVLGVAGMIWGVVWTICIVTGALFIYHNCCIKNRGKSSDSGGGGQTSINISPETMNAAMKVPGVSGLVKSMSGMKSRANTVGTYPSSSETDPLL